MKKNNWFGLQFIGLIFLTVIGVTLIDKGVEAVVAIQEKHECRQWQEQAEQYPGWYAASWQDEQCEFRGLPL